MQRNYGNTNLMDLRKIARQMGVKTPTSLRKDILIDAMNKVESGEVLPVFSKRGRPAMPFDLDISFEANKQREKEKALQDKKEKIEKLVAEFQNKLLKILQE